MQLVTEWMTNNIHHVVDHRFLKLNPGYGQAFGRFHVNICQQNATNADSLQLQLKVFPSIILIARTFGRLSIIYIEHPELFQAIPSPLGAGNGPMYQC